MKKLQSSEVRETFLDYFQKKDHLRIPSSSLLPKKDPTLLFINSGMAPLKAYFLGKEEPPCPRLCNVQPCIRTIDIEDVGDRHHLTLFEMLGSWSIGDYYKERAIELAFDLLLNHFGFPLEKLYATFYNGDPAQNLPPDETSQKAWEAIGMPLDHIVPLGADNFWGPAGVTGPCGPCTEVFFDTGEEHGETYQPGKKFDDKSRYIEIWNAGVFMQFNKKSDGTFDDLPIKSVDTGSGVERMAMVMNGNDSVYETDLMLPILNRVIELVGQGKMQETEYRIMTDHIKASTMILAEGVNPSNEGQGYIPRRLIRKCVALAVRSGAKPDLSPIIETVIDTMGDFYTHLTKNKDSILSRFQTEITEFEPVVREGLKILDNTLSDMKGKTVSGKIAFDLVATHGVPLEIISGHLDKKGFSLNQEEYERHYREHQTVSREGKKPSGEADKKGIDFTALAQGLPKTDFLGYEGVTGKGKVLALFQGDQKIDSIQEAGEYHLVLDQTPFYAESGGQVGDTGTFQSDTGEVEVLDTTKTDGIFFHKVKWGKGTLKTSQEVSCVVDQDRRLKIRRNHSATHLLQSALRKTLGEGIAQKGSYVDENRLRFDFQHSTGMTPEEIDKVENLVNQWIWENMQGDTKEMDYDNAVETGALALFGEKYGNLVRVVRFGDTSVEFCGGTHVEATGEIGLFTVSSEGSVARGIRRIEGTTGAIAFQGLNEQRRILKKATTVLGIKAVELPERLVQMKKQASQKPKAAAPSSGAGQFSYENKVQIDDQVSLLIARVDEDSKNIKAIGEAEEKKGQAQILCIAGVEEGKTAHVFVFVDKKISKKITAKAIIQQLLPIVEGRGGGKPFFAQGGGKKVDSLPSLLEQAEGIVKAEWQKAG